MQIPSPVCVCGRPHLHTASPPTKSIHFGITNYAISILVADGKVMPLIITIIAVALDVNWACEDLSRPNSVLYRA